VLDTIEPRDGTDNPTRFAESGREALSLIENRHIFTDRFLERYHQSLHNYRHFYDDLDEYGNPQTCNEVFYFIPGMSGTPGQVKFGLPSILKKFGNRIYVKCLHLDEFSNQRPTWTKYTAENLHKRRQQIVQDLRQMCERFARVRVIVSSTGFYDFLGAFQQMEAIENQLLLYWLSSAPDRVSRSIWESYFYRLNGFTYDGLKWYAYPNQPLLKYFNPECGTRIRWKHGQQRNMFFKNDVESRFSYLGMQWDYVSTECFNFILQDNLAEFHRTGRRVEIEAHVLAATRDGFWDESSPDVIQATVDRYIGKPRMIFKDTSHLWVVTPDNLSEMLE
jgi:hypothetical protein